MGEVDGRSKYLRQLAESSAHNAMTQSNEVGLLRWKGFGFEGGDGHGNLCAATTSCFTILIILYAILP